MRGNGIAAYREFRLVGVSGTQDSDRNSIWQCIVALIDLLYSIDFHPRSECPICILRGLLIPRLDQSPQMSTNDPLLRQSTSHRRLVRKATLLHQLNHQESEGDERSDISSDPSLQSFFKKTLQSYIVDPLQAYSCSFFLADLLAGLTISFVLIPQAIAFCTLAGVPPIMALTSAVFPVMVYALFGSSKHLAVGMIKKSRLMHHRP